MPPASFPALAAIRPGPSRARIAKSLTRQGLRRAGSRGRPRVAERTRRMSGGTRTAIDLAGLRAHGGEVYCRRSVLAEQAEAPAPAARQHRLEHVVDRHDTHHPLVLVEDRCTREV